MPDIADANKLDSLDSGFRKIADKVLADLVSAGHSLRIVWGRRTKAENDALVAEGTASANSKHLSGEAVDVIDRKVGYSNDPNEPYYKALAASCAKHGAIWGGTFTSRWDPNHFEAP